MQVALYEECKTDYPLHAAGITKADVSRFWAEQPFDLQLDHRLGNCDLCFLKSRSKKVQILRERPEVADWWARQEERIGLNGQCGSFQADHRYRVRDLLEEAKQTSRRLFPLPEEAEEEEAISCFCGD